MELAKQEPSRRPRIKKQRTSIWKPHAIAGEEVSVSASRKSSIFGMPDNPPSPLLCKASKLREHISLYVPSVARIRPLAD